MAAVAFNPIALIITEIDTGGDNEVLWQEIYSEWKDWLLDDLSRLGYPQAFRYVGTDPISPVRSLGTTFFLMNGWRLRPAERSHKLVLLGNCYTDPAGDSLIVPTLGAYTVAVEYSVSNLIDTVATGGGPYPTPAQIADALLDESLLAHGLANTLGLLAKHLDADVSSRAVAGEGLSGAQAEQLVKLLSIQGLNPAGPLVVGKTARTAPGIVQSITQVGDLIVVKLQ